MKIRLLALLTLAALSIVSATEKPSNAQVSAPATNPQNYDTNSADPFAQGVEQNPMSSIMNLIHKANFSSGFNPEFATEQSQQLDDATAAFRKKQSQLIQKGQAQPNQQGLQVIQQPSNSVQQQALPVIRLEQTSGN